MRITTEANDLEFADARVKRHLTPAIMRKITAGAEKRLAAGKPVPLWVLEVVHAVRLQDR